MTDCEQLEAVGNQSMTLVREAIWARSVPRHAQNGIATIGTPK
jgi:hypothetical protein